MKNAIFVLATIVATIFFWSRVDARDCNPDQQIKDCYPALRSQGLPSSSCCNELEEHKECLREYININNVILPPNYQFLPNISERLGINEPN